MTSTRHGAAAPRPTTRGIVAGVLGGAAAVIALLLGTAACGQPMQVVPAREAPPVSGPGDPTPVEGVLAATTTPLGTIVTSDGRTVYRFDEDSPNPSRTTCTGACATTWPPLLGDGLPALSGVSPDLVGTVGRPDGTQQLTLDGWPLYLYAADTAPGDTRGDGVGGTWRAIGVDGKPAADS